MGKIAIRLKVSVNSGCRVQLEWNWLSPTKFSTDTTTCNYDNVGESWVHARQPQKYVKENGEGQGVSDRIDWVWNFTSELPNCVLFSLSRPQCLSKTWEWYLFHFILTHMCALTTCQHHKLHKVSLCKILTTL